MVLNVGCDSSRYSAARRADTLDAYRRYLAASPGGKNADAARKRAETLEYKAARKADRPLGYNRYLQQHPRGKYALACRERLARLSLTSARTPADLMLVMERYEGTAEAKEAAKKLPLLLAAAALRGKDPAACQRFLDRYPRDSAAPRVRALLARLRYASLGAARLALESFAQEFAGTPEADRALARLRGLLAREVKDTLDPTLLRELEARFPGAAELKELRRLVLRQQLSAATARGDLAALEHLKGDTEEARRAAALVRWCAPRKRRCQKIREQARAAHTWRPAASLASIRSRVFSADLLVSWHAVTTLGWIRERAAGDALLELAGSSRISMIWMVERSLWRWLSRRGKAARLHWVERSLRRPYRSANPDARQRRGVLMLLSPGHAAGASLLKELSSGSGRELSATYLAVRLAGRAGRPVPRRTLARFARAAQNRINALTDVFPGEVTDDNQVAATLAERELFALGQAVQAAGARARLTGLRGKVAVLLSTWRVRLARASKAFQPAHEIRIKQVERHERGRPAALALLLRGRDPLSRAVGAAICEQEPLPPCGKKNLKPKKP